MSRPGRIILQTLVAFACTLALGSAPARAIIVNPLPTLFGADDGTQVFARVGDVIGFGSLTLLPDPSVAGLAPAGAPAGSVPLLSSADPANFSVFASFSAGQVVDQAMNPRGAFTPPSAGLSFFMLLPGAGLYLSTEETLNPDGARLVGTFPSLDTANRYLLEFTIVDTTSPANIALGLFVVDGVAPVSLVPPMDVPEPGTLGLLAGLMGVGLVRRRQR